MANNVGDNLLLMRRQEELFQAFGGHLHPDAQEQLESQGAFYWLAETSVESSVCFALRAVDGNKGVMMECRAVSCLADFLYLELGETIKHGVNADMKL